MRARKLIAFEVEKEERLYRFEFYEDAQLGDIYEVLSQFRNEVVRLINEKNEKENPPKETQEEPKKDD